MTTNARPSFTWLGHATVRCDLPGGQVLLIDPFLTGNPKAPTGALQRLERLDLVLVTHAHGDHAADVVALAARHGATVIATYDLCEWFQAQGVSRVSGMNLGGSQEAAGVAITMVRADHSSGFMFEGRPLYGGVAAGYVVRTAEGYCFYHAGDTALYTDMSLWGELYRPELAFLPIGDHFTMGPEEAARACRLLGVPQVVPIHWGTFPLLTGTPAALRDALRRAGTATEVIELEPGSPWTPPARDVR